MREGTNMPWEKYYDRLIKIIRESDHPYFMWVLLLDTHTPYIPPGNYKKWCKVNTWRLLYLFWKIERRNWLVKNNNSEINIMKDAYDDEIHYADAFIKKLWNDLCDDDPVFIIHADHGDGFGEHGFYRHPSFLYEELIHVPLVLYNTDSVGGKISKPVSLRSLPATVLELIGVENNVFSSKSVLNGGENYVISKIFDGKHWKIAVRTEDWKYIIGQKDSGELYYLNKDPYEQNNVLNDYPDIARDMVNIINQHLNSENEKLKLSNIIQKLKK